VLRGATHRVEDHIDAPTRGQPANARREIVSVEKWLASEAAHNRSLFLRRHGPEHARTGFAQELDRNLPDTTRRGMKKHRLPRAHPCQMVHHAVGGQTLLRQRRHDFKGEASREAVEDRTGGLFGFYLREGSVPLNTMRGVGSIRVIRFPLTAFVERERRISPIGTKSAPRRALSPLAGAFACEMAHQTFGPRSCAIRSIRGVQNTGGKNGA